MPGMFKGTRRPGGVSVGLRLVPSESLPRVQSSPALCVGPELGQLSAHLTAGGAIEGPTESLVQSAQVSDLHRSTGSCRLTDAHPPGRRPACDPDLVRKSVHCERQNCMSEDRGVAQGRKVTQVGS
jgi:hypothetical protein